MCGIAGYVGPAPLPAERVARCLALMGRRGPDGGDAAHFAAPGGRHVHLLHTRLAIIDLDPRANQPFRARPRFARLQRRNLQLPRAAHGARAAQRAPDDDQRHRGARDPARDEGPDALARCEGIGPSPGTTERTQRAAVARPLRREAALCLARRRIGLFRLGGQVPVRARRQAPAGQSRASQALPGERLQSTLQDARDVLRGPRGAAPGQLRALRRRRPAQRLGVLAAALPEPDDAMSYAEAVAARASA